jgi:hypothetical protein
MSATRTSDSEGRSRSKGKAKAPTTEQDEREEEPMVDVPRLQRQIAKRLDDGLIVVPDAAAVDLDRITARVHALATMIARDVLLFLEEQEEADV